MSLCIEWKGQRKNEREKRADVLNALALCLKKRKEKKEDSN